MQKISRTTGSVNSGSAARSGRAVGNTGTVQAQDGESTRIRVLDYLGGGKLVIDLKGQRVVAHTPLILEKNQELEVLVRNMGDRIVLKLISDDQQDVNIKQQSLSSQKTLAGDVIHQLMSSLEEVESQTSNGALKKLMQETAELVFRAIVDTTEGDTPQQVRNAILAQGHDYERGLADALIRGILPLAEAELHLKARLMKLRSLLSDEPQHFALLESVEKMLENMESQQLRSILQNERFQHFYAQIPFIIHDQTATAELEYFCQNLKRESDGDSFSLVLNFDLERLGHLEFSLNIMDSRIDCQIRTDDQNTHKLAKQHSKKLSDRLTALGYNIGEIHCIMDEFQRYRNQATPDDIDITA